MTQCNSQSVSFSSQGRRSVQADFEGGCITSDAGALLLREADRRLGLIDLLDEVIPDPRNQNLITHQQGIILRQRIFAIAMGYEDGNDHQQLRDDPLMQLVSERGIDPDQPLASPPTLCRLEILSLLVKRFRQVWPDVKIIFRVEGFASTGDSGFCRWKMLRWCERHDVGYIVGIAKNKRLEPLAQDAMNQAKRMFEQAGDGKAQRVFTEFFYAAGSWDRPRRIIAKAEYLGSPERGKPRENFRFVVTNLLDDGPWLYEKFYCKRGDAENRIKEQQLGLFADRTSCHELVPNQFRVMLSAAAYVLLQHIRQTALIGTELAEAQVSTIRLKLLKIGGLVKRTARRIVLHLASGCPQQQLFRLIAAKLISLPDTT